MYEYPNDLIEYLTEQESEGAEIFTTQCVDGTMWIIKPESLDRWYVLVTWYEGDNKFNMVNLCGKSVDRLKLLFVEDGVFR